MSEPAHEAAKWPRDPGWGDARKPERRGGDVLRLLPVRHFPEQTGARASLLGEGQGEAVDLVVAGHLAERIVGDGAGEVDIGF